MAIVHRRVFYGKVGQADKIVAALKEGNKQFKKFGVTPGTRILTDYNSGRTDRVIWEWEGESLQQMDSQMEKAMASAQGRKFFERWFAELSGLIHYADVDNFIVK
jgi:hypothetical protein